MANSKILTAEQERALRQPIDEYVGGIQKEIDALRKDGTTYEWDYEKNTELDPRKVLPKSGKHAWWVCSVCGNHWESEIRSRVNGHGCPQCGKRRKK